MSRVIRYADLFCGLGGMTAGMEDAIAELGATSEGLAINHWPRAIESHSLNHPHVRHLCDSITKVSPRAVVRGGYLDVLIAGPSCTHFSQAKGGKPVSNQLRMDPWEVVNWCVELDVRVRCVLIENVPAIQSWGPTCTLPKRHAGPCAYVADDETLPDRCDKVVPELRGTEFRQWVQAFRDLGYQVDHRVICCADFGDPTTRRRFFLQARNDGRPIRWPTPGHAPRRKVGLIGYPERPWVPSMEVLDWSDLGRSIVWTDREPLSEKTRLRIARGLHLYCGALGPAFVRLLGLPEDKAAPYLTASSDQLPELFRVDVEPDGRHRLVPFLLGQHGGSVARSASEPVMTVTSDGAIALVSPMLSPQRDSWDGRQVAPGRPRSMHEPFMTITTDPGAALVTPMLVPYYSTGATPRRVEEPVATIPTHDRFSLVTPMVVPYGPSAEARPAAEPMLTILTKERLALCSPFLVPYRGERDGQAPRIHSIFEPHPTVTTEPGSAVVVPGLVSIDGHTYALDIWYRMLFPHELAAATSLQGYRIAGTKTEVVAQIGNAVPRRTAKALCLEILRSLVGDDRGDATEAEVSA